MNVTDELKKLNEEFVQQKKELMLRTRVLFDKALIEVFDKHEGLESFGWTQYTPYFNDGDECTFSAHTDYLYINGVNEDDMDDISEKTYDYTSGKRLPNEKYNSAKAAMISEIKSILNTVDEEFLKETYNDHVKVTITREGSSVTNYRHD
jgi:hypothetical protein